MFKMETTVFMLMLLFAPGFAYWDDLETCINKMIQKEKESNTLNPTVEKLGKALEGCNFEWNKNDTDGEVDQGKELNGTLEFCVDFNRKIDFDHCFIRGMGWMNENETKMNHVQWGEDNESMATFLGLNNESSYEKVCECMCDEKDEIKATGMAKCKKGNHGVGHWYISSLARCVMGGMKAKCDIETKY